MAFSILMAAFEYAEAGESDAMLSAATQAFEIAERFGDADIAATALVLQGRARLATRRDQGRSRDAGRGHGLGDQR